MAKSEGTIPFSSLTKHDRESQDDENFISDFWGAAEKVTSSIAPESLKDNNSYPSNVIGDYNWENDLSVCTHPRANPEVNLKNLFSGLVAILTSRIKNFNGIQHQRTPSSNEFFLGSGSNGDSFLHPSVCVPSAPPLLESEAINYSYYREILEAEPPEWIPDSHATSCMKCDSPFTALTRGRHHCRFCGGIFCRACTKGRCLLPVKFRERDPQRVCDICYDRLHPLQGILINSISNAMQSAKHDVMDWTCTRGWLNLPVGLSMEHEIYKASNTLKSYCEVNMFCSLPARFYGFNLLSLLSSFICNVILKICRLLG